MFPSQKKNQTQGCIPYCYWDRRIDKVYFRQCETKDNPGEEDTKQGGGSRASATPEQISYMALEKSTRVAFGMVALSEKAVWLRTGRESPAV